MLVDRDLYDVGEPTIADVETTQERRDADVACDACGTYLSAGEWMQVMRYTVDGEPQEQVFHLKCPPF